MSSGRTGKFYGYTLRLRKARPSAPGRETGHTVFFVRLGESWGEACPMHGTSLSETARQIEAILAELPSCPAESPLEITAWLKERHPLAPAARAAVEMALYDDCARKAGLPLHAALRLPSPEGVPTSFRLALAAGEDLEARLEAARGFECLKLQGTGNAACDLEAIRWLAARTDLPLRVDAAGGWTFREALETLPHLAELRVEYLEQPLPRHSVAETAQLMKASPVPILLDEDACGAADLAHIAGCCNGFVIKLMTSGGLGEALRMIRRGRELGLRVALDATVESSLAVTAAAHLAGAVDCVDLGGAALLENDPFAGVRFEEGRLCMPSGPGSGVRLRNEYRDCFHHPYAR